MISKIEVFEGRSVNPYHNLAIEQLLFEGLTAGKCILYLWQNQNTVVIGRNQNAYRECKIEAFEKSGIRLARRMSGGGAVYHDLGNLNFTFIANDEDYDVDRQLSVISKAVSTFGIAAEKSGRNDLIANGCKFSGNAFFHSAGKSYHHGTLLVNVDMSILGEILKPSKLKLKAKGVDSVRSRVVNLSELSEKISLEKLRSELVPAFESVYGLKVAVRTEDDFSAEEAKRLEKIEQRNAEYSWNYGKKTNFDITLEDRFSFGEISIELTVKEGLISDVRVYSDAMNPNLSEAVEKSLMACPYEKEAVSGRLLGLELSEAGEICRLFAD